jgi:hypothetical protein
VHELIIRSGSDNFGAAQRGDGMSSRRSIQACKSMSFHDFGSADRTISDCRTSDRRAVAGALAAAVIGYVVAVGLRRHRD